LVVLLVGVAQPTNADRQIDTLRKIFSI